MDNKHYKWISEFTSLPHHVKRPHPIQYALDQRRLILEEVEELERKGVVSKLDKPKGGLYSNLFLVSKKDGSQRLVINLKALNYFVQPQHFKMEEVETL